MNFQQAALIRADLDTIDSLLRDSKFELPERILILGASGFLGKWITASIATFVERIGGGITVHAVTNYQNVVSELLCSVTSNPNLVEIVDRIPQDYTYEIVLDLRLPSTGPQLKDKLGQVRGFFSNVVQDFSVLSQNGKLICPSSGAVYGSLRNSKGGLCEDFILPSESESSIYGQAKRSIEELVQELKSPSQVIYTPRIFSVFGPLMREDSPLIGNSLIRQAVFAKKIQLEAPVGVFRDSIYIVDLIPQVLLLINQDAPLPYMNLGSENTLEVLEFARIVQRFTGAVIELESDNFVGDYYYPCLHNLKKTFLGKYSVNHTKVDESVSRTIDFVKSGNVA